MKFAKELESDLVPEWRAKYLDYKTGKKKLKAISRALRNAERTPQPGANSAGAAAPGSSTFRHAPPFPNSSQSAGQDAERRVSLSTPAPTSTSAQRNARAPGQDEAPRDAYHPSHSLPIPGADAERTPLQNNQPVRQGITRYGSIIASPPPSSPTLSRRDAPSLRLPGPAMDPLAPGQAATDHMAKPRRTVSHQSTGSAYQVGPTTPPPRHPTTLAPKYRSIFHPTRVNSLPVSEEVNPIRPVSKKAFSFKGNSPLKPPGHDDIAMNAYREVDVSQYEFFRFLDKELDKIEDFYEQKENEASDRLKILRQQLHIMRDQRVEDLVVTGKKATRAPGTDGGLSRNDTLQTGDETKRLIQKGWRVEQLYNRTKRTRGTKTAQAMKMLGTPSGPQPMDAMQDFVRSKKSQDIPYRTAKHKLKIALAEYYRGLELLKAYSLLNRTAFRKITKKFDKTVNARPSGRYMSEKVNKAYFVNSGVLESHIQSVEDLYARYFERGNHKIAVGKLRAKGARAGDYTGNVFRNGLLLGVGAVFAVQGVVKAGELLYHTDAVVVTNTSYLLQIYGGYAVMLLLTLLFCLACRVWQKAKVNYAFIFEFDTRHHLDWRQLAEIPCFLAFCFGLIMWLNFSRFVPDGFYIYWPVVLIGISALVLFNPVPLVYHRSRFWFINSNWRLLLAGIFPVEFRDFFLGDMYCSLTYALGNIELFFCLYAQEWNNPPMCNSSHSRLLGFFTTLPGIWRALQCLRRYWDTRNAFPHLVNCGKYMCTILYYVSLSLYRLDRTNPLRAFFIFAATINAIYCSIWDIVMDWSLMDPYAKHRFLRSTLAFKYVWWYYAAMIIDPIIRFNWIFYAIYANDTQHSSLVSFFVAFSEVLRRGMWTLFRVENEHCTNVGRFRASRDVPLPYEVAIEPDEMASRPSSAQQNGKPPLANGDEAQGQTLHLQASPLEPVRSHTSGTDVEMATGTSGSARQRRKTMTVESPMVRAFGRVGTALHTAHAQDFERRRRPEAGESGGKDIAESDDDDDDDDEDASTDSDLDVSGAALVNKRRQGDHHKIHGHGGVDGGSDVEADLDSAASSPRTPGERQAGDEDAEGDEDGSIDVHMSGGRRSSGE